MVRDDDDYIFNATGWMAPNEAGDYSAKIINLGYQGQDRCLWVDYVGLRITYYEMGETRIWNSINIPNRNVPKYSGFTVMGNVTCTGGVCGEVNSYLRFATAYDGTYSNVPSSGPLLSTYYPNPHKCGVMDHLNTCHTYWMVSTNKSGNYWIKMASSATEAPGNQTVPIMVSVNPGELSLSGSIARNTINISDPVEVKGNVLCGTAQCGNVKMLARYRRLGSVVYEIIGSSGNLSTGNTNPQDCEQMYPGSACAKSWFITGNRPGTYEIQLIAYSDDQDVENKTYDLDLVVNPEQTVGVLGISGFSIVPYKINVSESATLTGTVSCSEEYCGNVLVYVMSMGQKVKDNGIGTDDSNPQLCPDMDAGDYCSVSWEITGNSAGSYYMEIVADSDRSGVENKTSSVVFLDVTNPVGSLFFPFEPIMDPLIINISETASLTAVVGCDSGYCGKATALVQYNGINLGGSGDLSTNDPNPQECDPPCDFSWEINGSNSNNYDIALMVKSNVSGNELIRTYNLYVQDPDKPTPILSVSLGDLENKYGLGNAFTLKGQVKCNSGYCGETSVYAKYKLNEQDPWMHLSGTTPLFTPENPKVINIASGESKLVEWIVNSSQVGSFILGISADAADSGVMDSGTASKSIEVFKGADVGIEIQSPPRGQALARGDELLVKVRVTENGYPMAGGVVTASSEGFFPSTQLEDSGNGIYSKAIRVGNTVSKNSYVLKFYVRKDAQLFTKETNVYVNPELEISTDTDKHQYEVLEKVKLEGQVLKKGQPAKANVNLRLVCPSRSFKDILLETDGSGNFYHEYLISMATPAETCRFQLYTEDQNKNYNQTYIEVKIFPSEREVYRIDFVSPLSESKFKKGDPVRIRAGVTYGDESVVDADVVCLNPMLEENIKLTYVSEGYYDGDYIIEKEAPSGLWVLTCVATTPDGSFGRKSVNVYITPLELRLTEITPSKAEFFQPGDAVKIRVRLAYPDSKPFENSAVYLKIGNQVIYLNETGPGIYEGSYGVESQGIFTFDVYAEDQFGNTGMFPSGVVITSGFAPLSLLWIILPFVTAVALLAGVVWKRGRKEIIIREPEKPKIDRRTEIREEVKELERKIRDVEKAKEEVENEYYERKIDEKTFNQMIQNYEQERIRLSVERNSLLKELESPD